MGHASGYLPPGGRTHCLLQLRQIFKNDDHANFPIAVIPDYRRRHQNRQVLVLQFQLHLLFQETGAVIPCLPDKLLRQGEMLGPQDVFKTPVDDLFRLDIKHRFGSLVDGGDNSVFIHGDYPGRNMAEHRFHILPPLFEIDIGLLQLPVTLLQVIRHLVEGIYQNTDLRIGDNVDPMIEVPAGNATGGLGQVLDRDGNPLGKIDAKPRGGKNNEQHHDKQGDDVT